MTETQAKLKRSARDRARYAREKAAGSEWYRERLRRGRIKKRAQIVSRETNCQGET